MRELMEGHRRCEAALSNISKRFTSQLSREVDPCQTAVAEDEAVSAESKRNVSVGVATTTEETHSSELRYHDTRDQSIQISGSSSPATLDKHGQIARDEHAQDQMCEPIDHSLLC